MDITWPSYQRWRRAYLERNPLCVLCKAQGRTVAADEVDHYPVPRSKGGALMDEGNVRPLCREHHLAATGILLRTRGAYADGTPRSRARGQGGRRSRRGEAG